MALQVVWGTLSAVNFALECKRCWDEVHVPRSSSVDRASHVASLFSQGCFAVLPLLSSFQLMRGVRQATEMTFRAIPLIYSSFQLALYGKVKENRFSCGRGLGLHAFCRREIATLIQEGFISKSFLYLAILLNSTEICLRTSIKDKISKAVMPYLKKIQSYFSSSSAPTRNDPYNFRVRFVDGEDHALPDVMKVDPMFDDICPITHRRIAMRLVDTTTGQAYDPMALIEWLGSGGPQGWPTTRRPVRPQDIDFPDLGSRTILRRLARYFFWSYVCSQLQVVLPRPEEDFSEEQEREFCTRLKRFLETMDEARFRAQFDTSVPAFTNYYLGMDVIDIGLSRSALTNKYIRYPVKLHGSDDYYEKEELERILRENPMQFPGKTLEDIDYSELDSFDGTILGMWGSFNVVREIILENLNRHPEWMNSTAAAS